MRRVESGLALLGLVVVTAGSLPEESSAFGQIGVWVGTALRSTAGVAAWLCPLWLIDAAIRTFRGHYWSPMRASRWLLFVTLCALSLTLLAVPGGWIGTGLAGLLVTWFGMGAHLGTMIAWIVIAVRLLGPERVQSIRVVAATSAQTAIANRPRIANLARPVFAPVIDTVGEPIAPPVPVPVLDPVPAPKPPLAPPGGPGASLVQRAAPPRKPSSWNLPDVELLQETSASQIDPAHRQAVARNLEERLRHLQINATVAVAQQQGAVVSRYEIKPGPSTKISTIMALAGDLETAYKGFRFVQLHGTGRLGVEIPNGQGSTIALRTVLESAAWTDTDAILPLALGVTSSGDPVVIDLADTRGPHLLVAGTSGSGKSVGLNVMLVSLLLRHSPDDVQLLMLDPKRVELAMFAGLPHLICPPITELDEAIGRLGWAVEEMERRYTSFADRKVRNLVTYNERVKPHERLPYIVIVIDEYADLSVAAKDSVEPPVIRLAQMARAAGIHMILATQRPSVNVITGLIKANFNARIGYKTAQPEDSKTIIGRYGAEKLLGKGDSLCLIPQYAAELTRVHGAFISEEDVDAVVQSWTSQTNGERKPEPPRKHEAIIVDEEDDKPAPEPRRLPAPQPPAADDYTRAIELARGKGHASARLFVEELKIGTNKAKRLFARMHEQGLLKPGGPNNTHKFCGTETP